MAETDPACGIAHGDPAPPEDGRAVVAVFASPVARHLLDFARHAGFRTALVEPDPDRRRRSPATGTQCWTPRPGPAPTGTRW